MIEPNISVIAIMAFLIASSFIDYSFGREICSPVYYSSDSYLAYRDQDASIDPLERAQQYSQVLTDIAEENPQYGVVIAFQDIPAKAQNESMNNIIGIKVENDSIDSPEFVMLHFDNKESNSKASRNPTLWGTYWKAFGPNEQGMEYIETMTNIGKIMKSHNLSFSLEPPSCFIYTATTFAYRNAFDIFLTLIITPLVGLYINDKTKHKFWKNVKSLFGHGKRYKIYHEDDDVYVHKEKGDQGKGHEEI